MVPCDEAVPYLEAEMAKKSEMLKNFDRNVRFFWVSYNAQMAAGVLPPSVYANYALRRYINLIREFLQRPSTLGFMNLVKYDYRNHMAFYDCVGCDHAPEGDALKRVEAMEFLVLRAPVAREMISNDDLEYPRRRF
jgi:hypothetical protein